MEYREDPFLFPLVTEPKSRWEKSGLSPRQEASFNRVSLLLVALFLTGWIYTILLAPRAHLQAAPVARITDALTRTPLATDAPPEAAFLTDRLVQGFAADYQRQIGMASGAVRVQVLKPGEQLTPPQNLPRGAEVQLQPRQGTAGAATDAGGAAQNPGIWNVVLKMADALRPAPDVAVITLVPLTAKQGGR